VSFSIGQAVTVVRSERYPAAAGSTGTVWHINPDGTVQVTGIVGAAMEALVGVPGFQPSELRPGS